MSPLSDTPEETVRPELGVSDKEDTKNVRGRGGCRTGLKTIALEQGFPNMFLEPPKHCTFCMSPLSDTHDSTHQLVRRDCKT